MLCGYFVFFNQFANNGKHFAFLTNKVSADSFKIWLSFYWKPTVNTFSKIW